MKKLAAYIVLLLYVSVLLRPAVPFLAYSINYEYIAEVLCSNKANPEMNCNGNCYLTKSIQETQLMEADDIQVSLSTLLGKFPIAFQNTISYKFSSLVLHLPTIYACSTIGVPSSYINKLIHPPEFLVTA